MDEPERTHVAVVGAGMSGLRAAQRLSAHGLDVVVLEARGRVGGRAHDVTDPTVGTLEVGGQWVGPTQHAVHALLDELDVATHPTHDVGAGLAIVGGGPPTRFDDDTFGLDPLSLAQVGVAEKRLARLVDGVDVAAPWAHPHAASLDGQTFESWLRRWCRTSRARDFWRLVTRAVLSCEAHEVSLLHWLFYLRSGGGLEAVLATTGGAQQDRIVGGPQAVAERLAAELDVRLGSPVRGLRQDEHGVVVTSDGGAVVAEHVVLAVPPALYGRIDLEPALPGPRAQLHQHMPMGSVVKTHTVYEEPWWRGLGLSGQAVSAHQPVGVVFDNSPADRPGGVLLGFLEGEHARRASALGPAARRRLVEDSLVAFFGVRARTSIGYVEHDWCHEPWSGGAYGGRFTPGGWTTFGPTLRQPHGRIHFAGTETATVWNGYLDGAVSAGERAAAEIVAARGSDDADADADS